MAVSKSYGQKKSKTHSSFIPNMPQILLTSQKSYSTRNLVFHGFFVGLSVLCNIIHHQHHSLSSENTRSNGGKSLQLTSFVPWAWFKQKYCILHNQWFQQYHQLLKRSKSGPKKQELSSKDKSKATSSNELDELQLLKKEIKLLKKQKQLLLSKSTLSASPASSDHSDYDPWGGPCAQDSYDYWVEFLLLVAIPKKKGGDLQITKNKNQEKSPQRSRPLAKVRAFISLHSFCFAGFHSIPWSSMQTFKSIIIQILRVAHVPCKTPHAYSNRSHDPFKSPIMPNVKEIRPINSISTSREETIQYSMLNK